MVLHREKIDEKEVFLDVEEKQAEKKMTGCLMAMSSIAVMQRLEMYVGIVAPSAGAGRLKSSTTRQVMVGGVA